LLFYVPVIKFQGNPAISPAAAAAQSVQFQQFQAQQEIAQQILILIDIKFFQTNLSKRNDTQKAILFLDICHAGAVTDAQERAKRQINIRQAIDQLKEETGVLILASSTERQVSLEGDQYGGGHGAFTSAIIEALRGKADSVSGDKNGLVSVLEMRRYVTERVKIITDGRQLPSFSVMEGLSDFSIAKNTFP